MFSLQAESRSIAALSVDVLFVGIPSRQWDGGLLIHTDVELEIRRESWGGSGTFSWTFVVLFTFRYFVQRQSQYFFPLFFLFAVVDQFHQFFSTTAHTAVHLSLLFSFYRVLRCHTNCFVFYFFEKIDLLFLHPRRGGRSRGVVFAFGEADPARGGF